MTTHKRSTRNKRRPVSSNNHENNKGLHPRNIHNQPYNFLVLIENYPTLASHVKKNVYGNLSIEYSDALAVKALNAALLKTYYSIVDWDIPDGALCPAIPSRVDYIHYVAELLGVSQPAPNSTNKPLRSNDNIKLLDIGTGANGIYSLLACQIYGWHCVGSDINVESLKSAESIIINNPPLAERFTLRVQHNKNRIYEGIINTGELFDISVCNPPFHNSLDEALKSNRRKYHNLTRNRGGIVDKKTSPTLNFGGQEAELWCKGGERMFLKKLIKESLVFAKQCRWFTCLVSKSDNLKTAKKLLCKQQTSDIREIEMTQGKKITRILAWTYQ